MSNVALNSYLSPTLVLLAIDWDEGNGNNDFLGFAIKRTPGFRPKQGQPQNASDWLPNRLGFNGPNPGGADAPSNTNPIQHFVWWDSRIDTEDRGSTFTYQAYPVKGPASNPQLIEDKNTTIQCKIPMVEEQGIGTYFNRAVVSSQAFAREFGNITTTEEYQRALAWLSNGMNDALQSFIEKAKGSGMAGAAYHLTDEEWVIPALKVFPDPASFVYFFKAPSAAGKGGDDANSKTIDELSSNHQIVFDKRTKTNIMHDKFIVRCKNGADAQAVLTGTANFTTEGLTQQANVVHTFESPALADLYLQRQILLQKDPTVGQTADGAAWSDPIQIGDATIRVFFAPEKPAGNPRNGAAGSRLSIDEVVNAVKSAQSSVMFSLFSATDGQLLDACKSVADGGKLMRGLVNEISSTDPSATDDGTANASKVAATWLFERSKEDNMVVGHDSFGQNNTPTGFWQESNTLRDPSKPAPSGNGANKFIPNVYVHQKIVIVDGETANPKIYVGSANLSGNSTWHNDENLLEITKCPRLAKTYVAEFMRLYEQYRARFSWNRRQANGNHSDTFTLTSDASWAKNDYTPGTMEFIARKAFVGS
ncbi:MAG: phospholipase [Bacteroidetes bacterium]|nr:MAG: phospholipase [Bacteroidota bacterium]